MKLLSKVVCLWVLSVSTKTFAIIGNVDAPNGGTFLYNLGSEPTTLNPITSEDAYAGTVHKFVVDTLMYRDSMTYEFKPALAEKYEISKDGLVFTFTIRKGVVFHDGKPLTTEDVKFSFDVIFDPTYNAARLRSYYEGISKAELIDSYTIKFTAKEKYFGNFESLALLSIVPKHIYGNAKDGVKLNKTIVGSGPYFLEGYEKGKKITLKKFDKWWGNEVADLKGRYHFSSIAMRFVKEEAVALERIKKGEIDYDAITPEAFVKKTTEPIWNTKIKKYKVENKAPKDYGFIGWNLKSDLFKEKNTRVALTHLFNRAEMNKKFRFDMSLLATGPWYQQSDYADPNVKPIEFDPKKAMELLNKVGWEDKNKDGVLEKSFNGQPRNFEFTLLFTNKDTEKYLTTYQQELQKTGIKMNLKQTEWNTFVKLLDEKNFDAVVLAWSGGSVDLDPKQIWHSASATKGGSNFISYSNSEVDKLIDEARAELDKEKRKVILRKVYKLIAEDAPYLFWFNNRYILYVLNNRIGQEQETYTYEVGINYWWLKKQ